MTIVVDASAVVAALVDGGSAGAATTALASTTNILRRAVVAGTLSIDLAALAHADLVRLRIALFPYEPHAERVWALRGNLTSYDAWYVALAEALEAPLVTLDRRVARATGPRCEFRLPPS